MSEIEIRLFCDELERFLTKYRNVPCAEYEDAVDAYWREVADAMLKWDAKYKNNPNFNVYHGLMFAAYITLEVLYKQKNKGTEVDTIV